MMNKKEFMEYFKNEESNSIAHIYEKYKLTDYDIEGITDFFYPPPIWTQIKELEKKLGVKVETFGYFNNSERRVLSFRKEEDKGEAEVPFKLLEIKNLSKFRELSHRDYLGGVMSLGIKREKIGDLVVKDGSCYFPTFGDIAEVIIRELNQIGKNPVEIDYCDKAEVSPEFQLINCIVASNRLDSVVAAITKKTREESVKMIERGEVTVNYLITKSKSFKIDDSTMISIKGFGKYEFLEKIGETKKEKMRVQVKQYQ